MSGVSFTLRPLNPRGKQTDCAQEIVLVRSRDLLDSVGKRKSLSLPGIELRLFGRPAPNLVTMLTELLWLQP
jgi:hypothetical protein